MSTQTINTLFTILFLVFGTSVFMYSLLLQDPLWYRLSFIGLCSLVPTLVNIIKE